MLIKKVTRNVQLKEYIIKYVLFCFLISISSYSSLAVAHLTEQDFVVLQICQSGSNTDSHLSKHRDLVEQDFGVLQNRHSGESCDSHLSKSKDLESGSHLTKNKDLVASDSYLTQNTDVNAADSQLSQLYKDLVAEDSHVSHIYKDLVSTRNSYRGMA